MDRIRRYLTDSYRCDFDDAVVEKYEELPVVDSQRRVKIWLNFTYFYPTSGGQPNDTGTINGCTVYDATLDEATDQVCHFVQVDDDTRFRVGEAVNCKIDWQRRLDNMQAHSGQHLVSALLRILYGRDTVSVHFSAESCSMDTDTIFDKREDFDELERQTAHYVHQNLPITVKYLEQSTEEVKRSGHAVLRVVSIKDLDDNPCCGTHVSRTGEIGPFIIKSASRVRKSTRIICLFGRKAILAMQQNAKIISQCTEALKGSSAADLPALFDQLVKASKAYKKEKAALMNSLSEYAIKELYDKEQPDSLGRRVVVLAKPLVDELENGMARAAANLDKCIFIAYQTSEGPPYKVFVGTSLPEVSVEKVIKVFGGKGGGSPKFGYFSTDDVLSPAKVKAVLAF